MGMSMLHAAGGALLLILDPYRLLLLATGVVVGLVLGILPGIGGLGGLALLLPFTFKLDPHAAFALLLGMAAAVATGDPIPAILFGVPGHAGSAATVLDGLPMSKRGEAGRALSASYMSSLLGGVFGALLLDAVIPLMRLVVLYIGSPELLGFATVGVSMVAVLSGNVPLRGLAAAGFGFMLSMVGSEGQTGTLRWTMDLPYLWQGLPLVPVVLGLYALPELCDLLISRTSIAPSRMLNAKAGMLQGAKDCLSNWWLVLRCSCLGSVLGAVPGLGGAVIDWLAYAHALRTEKGAQQTFGRGDVRGVIAAESANNAREGGALVPTVAFGVPGTPGMAILLGAFMIQGLSPGPDMLTKNLDVTYSMVWSIALANILGAGLCYAFSGQFARLATLRYSLILPSALSLIYIGAFQGERDWGDLFTLFVFGIFGWTMKQAKWPRPPLILGLVLGSVMERYMFISIQRYGLDWLTRPLVIVLFALALSTLVRPLWADLRAHGSARRILAEFGRPRFRHGDLFYGFLIVVLGIMVVQALHWRFAAKVMPLIVGGLALSFTIIGLLNRVFRRPAIPEETAIDAAGLSQTPAGEGAQKIHMDIESTTGHLPVRLVLTRAAIFFGWLVAFMASMASIGLIPTVPLFVIAFMRLESRERWRLVLPQAISLTAFIYVLFDRLLLVPWPPTLLGAFVPALKFIPSV